MKTILVIAGLALMLSGCGHARMRGTVAMKIGKESAHVCLGDKAVKGGDKVTFYKNSCKHIGSGRGGIDFDCDLKVLGEGFVEKTLNNHYSLIRTDGSFDFEEGTLVEKAP